MKLFLYLSDFIVPLMIFGIICYGITMKIPVYDTFVKGAGLLLDVYKEYGTDSYLGLVASISMSCTETIFYTMSVYFMTAKVTKTRYTLPGALLATLAGLAASVVLGGVVK